MIGEYVNTGRDRKFTISPAVPGAQYRITAWALVGNKDNVDGRRSKTPAVQYATINETSGCGIHGVHYYFGSHYIFSFRGFV